MNFPLKLNNQIAALCRSIETGDGKPTAQSYVVFRELSERLDVQLKRLNEIAGNDLAALNKLLGEQKLAPIAAEGKR